ncbi:MAG: SMC-Scp complex subunit ScpB [Nitrospirales bacterium]
MMANVMTNGHVSSEVVEVELSENEGSLEVEVNGNNVGEQAMDDGSIQGIHWDLEDIKATLEALLFVSHDPLTMEKLASVLEGVPKSTLKTTMQVLQDEYEQVGRGLLITEVAGGFVMVTRPEHSAAIKRLSKAKTSTKLSRSALEAMAIISYKQPITRSEIEKIRGVETSGVLRTLLDQKMIRIVGRQEIPGRPILYGTGKQFLQRFGLRDLRDLPPLKELKDLGASESLSLELPFDSQDSQEESRVADLSA